VLYNVSMAKKKAELLAEKEAELAEVKAAISAVLSGSQSYKIGTRSLERADLKTLRDMKKELEEEIRSLEGGGGRVLRVVPVD